MNIRIIAEGEMVANINVDLVKFAALLSAVARKPSTGPQRSADISVRQVEELLGRLDAKSVLLLKRIAENDGEASWAEMQEIYGLDEYDWSGFSSRYGKGITRSLRNITGVKSDILLFWDDEEWPENDWSEAKVYIDGSALRALKDAFKI
ncbi:MAG: hypothetical protein LCH61_02465 [Proteobacteria bacterium]|nr:hypothetical protein [Pseudomonadota bacterium]